MNNITEITTIVGAAGGGAYWAWKKIIKPFAKSVKAKKEESRLMLAEIHSELKFNGGTSLKDAIYSVKGSVEKIEIRMDGIEENQWLAMNLQNVAFWESDSEGNIIYASPELCKVVGRSESEILGANWTVWLHDEDKERVIKAWERSVRNKTAFDEFYKFKKGDGFLVKVWGTAFPRAISKNNLGGKMGKLVPIEAPFR